jgi:hypothetical protein
MDRIDPKVVFEGVFARQARKRQSFRKVLDHPAQHANAFRNGARKCDPCA